MKVAHLPNHPISVARQMAAEDARWIANALLSAGRASEPIVPLLIVGHASRIVHEGTALARSTTKVVADPALAAWLPSAYDDLIERARHATKLFDDTSRPYKVLLSHMDADLAQARQEFLGNTPFRWARRFEGDLGMFRRERRLDAVTPTLSYRMGEPPGTSAGDLAAKALSVFTAYGQAISVLAESAGHPYPPARTLSLKHLGYLSHRDRRSDKYLSRRFDASYAESLKLVLVHVSGELNTLRYVLPSLAVGHEKAAFRTTVIGVYHAVNALEHADKEQPAPVSRHVARMRTLLGSPEWQRLNSPHGKLVRNRSMHDEIRSKLTSPLDPAQPMNGIIEALPRGRSYVDYLADLTAVHIEASDLLHDWCS